MNPMTEPALALAADTAAASSGLARIAANRWRAAGIHLALSAAVAGLVVVAMLAVFFAPPYFAAIGASTLLVLLIGVDVILGPLLTLIVYDPRKKSLKWDLAIIALLQVAALAFGLHVTFQTRPVYLVFVKDRLELVTAGQILPAELDKVRDPRYSSLPLVGPVLVGARVPADPAEAARIAISALGGADVQVFPQHYVPYETLTAEVLARSLPVYRLYAGDPQAQGAVKTAIENARVPEQDVRFLPVRARVHDLSALVDRRTGAIFDVVRADPWGNGVALKSATGRAP